jgi:DNA (cytosine-5)-methyltransferase 1
LSVYYSEHDRQKAAVLRELIREGVIAPGDVDERSIKDVTAGDVRGYTQCHFFAGIGVWSYAARLAGWPDSRPMWTGSSPCPSFSAAGKGGGFDDPRHLWPDWARLIGECRPAAIFGEQADDAIGYGWLDLVQTDLEAADYAVGKAILGACSVGAPHIRQRCYFCADAKGRGGWALDRKSRSDVRQEIATGGRGISSECADADGGQPGDGDLQRSGEQRLFSQDCGVGDGAAAQSAKRRPEREEYGNAYGRNGSGGRCESVQRGDSAQRGFAMHGSASGSTGHAALAIEAGDGLHAECAGLEGFAGDEREWRGPGWLDPQQARSIAATGATRGWWADCDWWYGRDGKYRPAGPGVQPLAHGAAARVLQLRCFGDAIVAPLAAEWIAAYMDVNEGGPERLVTRESASRTVRST